MKWAARLGVVLWYLFSWVIAGLLVGWGFVMVKDAGPEDKGLVLYALFFSPAVVMVVWACLLIRARWTLTAKGRRCRPFFVDRELGDFID